MVREERRKRVNGLGENLLTLVELDPSEPKNSANSGGLFSV